MASSPKARVGTTQRKSISVDPETASQSGKSDAGSTEEENIKVICRIRPFNQREIELHNQQQQGKEAWDQLPIRSIIDFRGSTCVFLDAEKNFQEKERFGFDACLWSIPDDVQTCENGFATQAALFDEYGKKMLLQSWKGYNTCFFAYGQTGAGKTFSMMGPSSDPGLIPRVCQQLFVDVEKHTRDMESHKDSFTTSFRVSIKYLEIYNEHVSDLLYTKSTLPPEQKAKINFENMKVRSSPATGVYIDHLTQVEVESWKKMEELLELGNASRHTAATKMNERSSRSHAVFKVELRQLTTTIPKKQFEKPNEHVRESTINLVDLAGSERNKKTQATGERLREAASINKSLSCLKGVIDVLVDNCTLKGPKKRPPYRDSTLTSILMDSLGGNSKTFMLIAISPHPDNADETLQTLRYGARARQIVHTVKVNENTAGRMMLELEEELERMKGELEKAQTTAKPEVVEQLTQEIQEQEETRKQLETKIQQQKEVIRQLAVKRNAEKRRRETRALANLYKLTQTKIARQATLEEYEALRKKLNALKLTKGELTRRTEEAEGQQQQLQQKLNEHKHRTGELEASIQQYRRQNATLEGFKRDLQKTIDDQESELAHLKSERIAVLMRARYHSAQTIVEYKHLMEDQQAKHDAEVDAFEAQKEAERDDLMNQILESEQEVESTCFKLQQELNSVVDEEARLENERGAHIEKLEKELKALQEQRKKRTQEGEARVEKAKAEWEKRYATMEQENQREFNDMESGLIAKQQRAEEEENARYEENVKRWKAEYEAAQADWAKQLEDTRSKREAELDNTAAEWKAKIDAKLAENALLRKELDVVMEKEHYCSDLARRIATVSDSDVALNSSQAALLQEYLAEHRENAPSLYKANQLRREDVTHQTRCVHAPVVANDTSKPASAISKEKSEQMHSLTRLRPRSPRR